MAIVKMNKFNLLAFESQKDELLENLQKFQGVQFINLQDENLLENNDTLKELKKDNVDSKCLEYEENLSKIKIALDFLQNYAPRKSGIKSLLEDKKEFGYEELANIVKKSNWKEICLKTKQMEEKLNNLNNLKTKYKSEIKTLEMWTNFDSPFKNLRELEKTKSFLGTASKQYESKLISDFNEKVSNGYLEILNSNSQEIFLFSLVHKSEKEEADEILKKYGFSQFSQVYDDKPLDLIKNYKNKIIDIEKQENKVVGDIKQSSLKIETLECVYEYFNTLKIREYATNNFLKTQKIVTISGWNPINTNKELENSIKKCVSQNYYLEFSDVKDDEVDDVPIKLKNGSFSSSFEDLVAMYSLPSYKEVDPTPILSVFYFIFFGMMLSDAGYGLVIVIFSLIAMKKTHDEEKKKKFKLFFFAGLSTVMWGAIYGGWFGDIFNYFGIHPPMLLNPAKDISKIFILSLIFGIVHIFIGLGIKAYMLIKSGHIKDAIYDVFTWYSTLIGAILMLIKVGGPLGKWMLIIGLVGLLLTQGRTAPTLIGKIAGGVYGVYGITGYLGDVVSYSRLLALGLATGFIANALNLIISIFPVPIRYVLAPILFVGLHLFNLLINALGAYVHAARLQYLEFFSKFYEGGGKKFTPFRFSEKYVKIKE